MWLLGCIIERDKGGGGWASGDETRWFGRGGGMVLWSEGGGVKGV